MRSLLLFKLYVLIVWAFVRYCSGVGMQRVNTFPGAVSSDGNEYPDSNIPADNYQLLLNPAQVLILDRKYRLTPGGIHNLPSGQVCYPQDVRV